ncbi:sulfotransferase [Candidatus Neomarinimicrobiota bacterium]
MLPNFIIVGAPKSGTTSLWHYLSQHPQIYMSLIKEPHYFSTNQRDLTLIEYEKLFRNRNNEIAVGEASTSYLWYKGTAERIKESIPNCKIIIILRNPADRLYSAYLQHKRIGAFFFDFKDIVNVLNQEQENINKKAIDSIWNKGFYSSYVENYYRVFGRKNVSIHLFNDLINSPQNLLESIFDFLNVDKTFTPNMRRQLNVGGDVGFAFLPKLFRLMGRVFKPLITKFIKYDTLNYHRHRILGYKKIKHEDRMDDKLREEISAIYFEDIKRLQIMIDRNLDFWVNPMKHE